MITTLAVISLIVLTTYLVYMAVRYGVKEYVSDNYYVSNHNYMFTAVMLVVGITLFPSMMEKGGYFRFLSLFASFGLILVAMEPHYKAERMHAVGAVMTLVSGTVWVATFHPIIVSIALVCWAAYKLLGLPKPYYWGEVAAFALVFGTILI